MDRMLSAAIVEHDHMVDHFAKGPTFSQKGPIFGPNGYLFCRPFSNGRPFQNGRPFVNKVGPFFVGGVNHSDHHEGVPQLSQANLDAGSGLLGGLPRWPVGVLATGGTSGRPGAERLEIAPDSIQNSLQLL